LACLAWSHLTDSGVKSSQAGSADGLKSHPAIIRSTAITATAPAAHRGTRPNRRGSAQRARLSRMTAPDASSMIPKINTFQNW